MKLMGHSKYETTLRYAHVREKSQDEAVEKLAETPKGAELPKGTESHLLETGLSGQAPSRPNQLSSVRLS
jgi:ferritin-like metal-binding protein YciE